ncbi:CvpA family protein [Pediococcus pentosaceus]|uniref:CvpA family protein n=1 Tax=Pediococcus pentosaceus TaxID=1255 RepID=UPI0021A5A019|nr:CvpA family protein [Pediococcus pentosaceus]MCT3020359.1 CvpA family protein [Pediococcus pentosaceus]
MLLSLIIILILIMAIARGWRRGLILELLYSLGYIVAFIFAKVFTNDFAAFLTTTFGGWTSNQVTNLTVMHSVAFILLMSIGWIIIRLVGRLSQMVTWLPVIHQVNSLAGAVVGLVITYGISFVILSISQFIPNDFYQEQLSQSVVAQTILSKTPAVSSELINNYIIHTEQTKNVL